MSEEMTAKRINQISMMAMRGNRDGCKTDEERTLYDGIRWEYENLKPSDAGIDMLHDND
jgi:hypothetical protein